MTGSPGPGAGLIRIGHSPDPDDAFMFYALLKGEVRVPGIRFAEVVEPIEDLNRRALRGELEMTALSAHAYARCSDRYRILAAGSSVGRGYGPVLVGREAGGIEALAGEAVAIPGELTTAALVARLIMPAGRFVSFAFDEIPQAVLEGRVKAGVLIHEGQLTYAAQGLARILDFGVWWDAETGGLPLPLGLDAVRRDLGAETTAALSGALRDSIAFALDRPDGALEYARGFGRGIDPDLNRRFVGMYVNRDTRDLPEDGVTALAELYRRAVEAGLIERVPELDIVR